jgi:GT2 family glycosyltransferase
MLIVENASTDDTFEVARTLAAAHACVRVVREPRLGLSYGRNTALTSAKSRYVLFLDDDALAEPNWLAGYRRFLETPPAPDIAAAGSMVIPRYDVPVPRWLAHGENTLNVAAVACPMAGRSFPWGCNFVCDRVLALALGGFDTRLGRRGERMGAHEETDLFLRLRAAGYSVWWLPYAPIRHRIASHRLRVGFHCYSALASGRSAVALRLRERPGRRRQCELLLGRVLMAPIVSLAHLAVALVTAPFRDGQMAVKSMAVAARSFGILWQLLLETPRILAGDVVMVRTAPRELPIRSSASAPPGAA